MRSGSVLRFRLGIWSIPARVAWAVPLVLYTDAGGVSSFVIVSNIRQRSQGPHEQDILAAKTFIEYFKRPENRKNLQALAESNRAIQAARLQYQEKWQAEFGENEVPPITLDDWKKAAYRVGFSPDWVRKGKWTAKEISLALEGYLLALKDKRDAKSKRGTSAEGMVSAPDLGKELGLDEKAIAALGNRLKRWRRKHEDGWMEVEPSEREPHGPQFLYNRDAIRPVIAKSLTHKT